MTASQIEDIFSLTGVIIMSDDEGNINIVADTHISDDLHAKILATIAGPVTVISPRQMRRYLLKIGKLSDILSILDTLPGEEGEIARIEWEYSTEIHRDNPLTIIIGTMIGIDSSALDAAFAEAATL